jgi:hypothetical protein
MGLFSTDSHNWFARSWDAGHRTTPVNLGLFNVSARYLIHLDQTIHPRSRPRGISLVSFRQLQAIEYTTPQGVRLAATARSRTAPVSGQLVTPPTTIQWLSGLVSIG